MANYSILNSKTRFPGEDLYWVQGPGKVPQESTTCLPPLVHIHLRRIQVVTYTTPYILILVGSGEDDLKVEYCQGGEVAKGQRAPCGVGGATVERRAASLLPVGMISGRSTI